MEKLTAIVERTGTGYSAFLPEVAGVTSTGASFGELRNNLSEALSLYLEKQQEDPAAIPEILKKAYTLEFKFDIQTFMEWISKIMSQRGLSEVAAINECLLSQYAHGIKKPGPKQLKRLETALHQFAEDLKAVTF
mgnify:FL=1